MAAQLIRRHPSAPGVGRTAAYPVGMSAATDGPVPSMSVTCTQCGAMAETAPLTWLLEVDPQRGRVWICDRCARTHLRAIEAKLEPEWW